MGRGSYTANDWAKLRIAKNFEKTLSADSIFANKSTCSQYDSRNISMRESRDSKDSPKSTPVIIGFDATGSMGYLAKELAVNSLNKTVMTILEQKPITNPHILCAAIGDCKSDKHPLQVTQFEADIRMIEQLIQLYLEGGGGGNGAESYNLLWYFAAYHTLTDCNEKRQEKGLLFTIGDDNCHGGLGVHEINRVFGDTVEYSLSNTELLAAAGEKYNIVHIHIERNNQDNKHVFNEWKKLLPGRCAVINENDIQYLSALICSIVSVISGQTENEVLKKMDQFVAEKISASMAMISQEKIKKTITF